MRILFLGDVVGRPGRAAVQSRLADLRQRWRVDCVVVNGENAAGGFGISEAICDELLEAGADAITLGNHAFDQREALVFIERQPRLVRPANYPPGTPGRGASLVETAAGARVLVINVMGRLFMDALDDPFTALDRELDTCPLGSAADAVVVDVHAEATSEKQVLAYHCDGRASLVIGTHTHVPTADERILPGGTAFQTDTGMCGDYDSVIGMEKSEPMRRFLQKTPGSRLEVAAGEGTLCGLAVETDDRTGLAVMVAPVRIGPHLVPVLPSAWEPASPGEAA
jgi:2',3'-cyclic-nucleotide 2'-phosphodiesterase